MELTLFTLEIRTLEGELWFLRARASEHIQYMLANKIFPADGFATGEWKIIIRPYNEKTDFEDIGNLQFLENRTKQP